MLINFKKNTLVLISLCLLGLSSCDTETKKTPEPLLPEPIEMPESYSFTRNGSSTVDFSGQTERIQMAMELNAALKATSNATETSLLEMFRNETETGGDANPFSSAALNASTKSIKSKVAASKDYFSSNASEASILKQYFENWLSAQALEVMPNKDVLASAGVAGQAAAGTTVRYVGKQGYEYNQLIAKSLIGGLMLDQIANNYLSASVLDEADNRAQNEAKTTVEGKNYTNMEHKWDEAYGYLFGNSETPENPLAKTTADDSFLNNYMRQVDQDSDFSGLTETVFNAFKLGRAAIVAGDYELRDKQADIIKENLSKVVAVRTVYYLLSGKAKIEAGDRIGAFHDLSEGVGFAFSLRFTQNPATGQPYISSAELAAFIQELFKGNGAWDVTPEMLGQIGARVSSAFGFTEEQALN